MFNVLHSYYGLHFDYICLHDDDDDLPDNTPMVNEGKIILQNKIKLINFDLILSTYFGSMSDTSNKQQFA